MNKEFFKELLLKVENPARVAVNFVDDKYVYLASAKNENDTYDWFCINSNLVEESLSKNSLAWCYAIETAPNKVPCIYMFIGNNLTKEYIIAEFKEDMEKLPEEIHIYFEDKPFSSIDIDKYDGSLTVLDKELIKHASDVFRVSRA